MGVNPGHVIAVTCICSRDFCLGGGRKGKLEVPTDMLEVLKGRLEVLDS